MVGKKDHVFCVTCQTQLPPDTEIFYFAQSAMFPTKDDLSFGDEIVFFINHMAALFDIIGTERDELEDEGTVKGLGKLGYDVAQEAKRRMQLLGAAQRHVSDQVSALRKRLGEEEVA